MIIAIIAGIAVGAAAFAPLVKGMNLARAATDTSNISQSSGLLLGVFGSFAILAVAAVLCIVIARPQAVAFVLAMAASLAVTAVAYGIWRNFRR